MDYPDNDYLQKQQPLFDDNTLEKEFSDPKLALDFDGDIVFYDEDVPKKQAERAKLVGEPPKKKKGLAFLIIASVLFVCSAVFAVLMFIRMTNNSKETQEETTAATAATEVQATEQTTEPAATEEPSVIQTVPALKETVPQRETNTVITAPTKTVEATFGAGTIPGASEPNSVDDKIEDD